MIVSDRAREAAAEWCADQPFPSKQAEAPAIREGSYDHHSLVQAFARFEAEIREECAAVAETLDMGATWSTQDSCSRFHTRNAIAAAIRQKGQP